MDFSQLSPQTAAIILLAGLSFLLNIGTGIVSIVTAFRRRPPIDQELINYVRHPDLLAAKAELSAEIREHREHTTKTFQEAFAALRTQSAATEKTFQDLQRMIGRIEGRLENCPNVCHPQKPRG